jgi:uncharacterized membrane protein YfcA
LANPPVVDPALAASLPSLALLAVVSFLAGGVNSVAGGGTILTFPALVAILPADAARMVTANATSTLGLWPASLAAAWAYGAERQGQPPWARWLFLPSIAGAVIGVGLVLLLPPEWFEACVPWLILSAASLFALQPRIAAWLNGPAAADGAAGAAAAPPGPGRLALAAVLQLLVAVYGGYFGAGIGILMLAVLGLLGVGDIHRLNGVKNVLAAAINGTAAALFAAGSLLGFHDVSWLHAGIMAVAGSAGAVVAARLARRLPAAVVRQVVAVIGFALAARYFLAG